MRYNMFARSRNGKWKQFTQRNSRNAQHRDGKAGHLTKVIHKVHGGNSWLSQWDGASCSNILRKTGVILKVIVT